MREGIGYQVVEETLRTVSDSVTKDFVRNGAKKLVTGKAAGISVGIRKQG